MNLGSKQKVEPMFSMASMTDLIFLLLIFFMLTSSFVTPSGLPVSLPTAIQSKIEVQKVSVTVTERLEYFVNDKKVSKAMLEGEIKSKLTGKNGSVILHIDRNVPWEHGIYVADIATKLEAKVVVATKPK
jgi:biopolymer transport protein ExbD